MKSILGALALFVAAPALAQQTPAADPHAGHGQHQGHGQDNQAGHSGHSGPGEHKMDCCKTCCDKMKQQGKPMACCDEHGEAPKDAVPADPQHNH